MKQNDRRIGVSDILLLVFSVVELIGIRTFFAPCGPKEDGSWMSCHWAGQAATGTAAVLVVLALVHLLVRNRGVKLGLDAGLVAVAVCSALFPGKLIGLCMMADMRCHRLTVPGVTVCAVLVVLSAALDAWTRRERHGL